MMSKNSYSNFSKVLLESIQDSQIDDENLEPQFVRIRNNNNGYIYLSTVDASLPDINHPAKIQLIARDLFGRKIRRYTIVAGNVNYRIPNVNPLNHQIIIFSSVTGLTYSVNVVDGFYSTPATLMTAIITALNTVTGSSGLTFSSAVNSVDPSVYTISAAGGNFNFITTSTMYLIGSFLVNLNGDQTPTSSKVVGPINLYYTRWIDIDSQALEQYNKNPSNATDPEFKNSNILRIWLYPDTNQQVGTPFSKFYDFGSPLRWVNFLKSQSLSIVDLTFYDEWGNELYIPNYGNTPYLSAFWIDLILLTEL
jgi:hypothetical protein